MNYRLYQMEFLNGIHFGIQALDDTQIMLPADTLFSALCQEALRIGKLEELIFLAEQGDFLLSTGFPYVGKDYFLPKPMLRIEADQKQGDSVQKKQFKNMKFVIKKCLTKFSPGGIINKLIENSTIQDALVAQLDRVTGYEPVGRGFESLQARQTKRTLHLQCPFSFGALARAGVALCARLCGMQETSYEEYRAK